MKFGMIIGNGLANTHTKFHYNRFLRSEDTSDPRGEVKPEIRRRRRPKFAVGEMPVGPSAAGGRAGGSAPFDSIYNSI